MNIVDAISKFAGSGNTLDSISSAIGLGRDETQQAVKAGVPSLLAGFTQLTSTGRGAQQLTDAISAQEPGVMDNPDAIFSGRGTEVIDRGSNTLTSLLGGGIVSKLSGVLSNFTGAGQGATAKLLGLLTPMLLGFLGKQQRTMGLDSTGLANLLAGQKDNIRSAMPPGLGSVLSSVFPGASLASSGARATTPPQVETKQQDEYQTEPIYGARSRPGPARWAIPAVLVAALLAGIAVWSNRNRNRTATVEQGRPATESRVVTGSSSRVASDTSTLVNQAGTTLASIKDSTSAEAAVPQLTELNQKFANLRSTSATLPDNVRQTMRQTVAPVAARTEQQTANALSIPGLSEKARAQIEELRRNLTLLSE